jgi:hypothetical protein
MLDLKMLELICWPDFVEVRELPATIIIGCTTARDGVLNSNPAGAGLGKNTVLGAGSPKIESSGTAGT